MSYIGKEYVKGGGINSLPTFCATPFKNKAEAISAELLALNLKNKLKETWKTGLNWKKQGETGNKGKTGRKKH